MRVDARAALVALLASGLAGAAASRVNVARRSALEAKSKAAIAAKPPGKSAPPLASIRAAALASFDQEKKTKGAPRSLLALSPAVAVAIQGAFPTPTPGCATPKITQVSAAPPLDPGDEVILNGCGFGGAGGGSELRLVGNFPGGYAKFKASVWHDDAIKAVLDPAIRGAFDQNAQMQVVRGDLKLSNQVPIAFRAAREVVLFEEKNTINVACGGDASGGHFNHCRTPFQGGLSIPMPGDFTMGGVHWVNDGDLDNEGTDEIRLNLQNGWKTCGYGWEWWYEYPGTGYANAPQGYADNKTSLTLKVAWGFTRDGMQYHVDVYAIGPAGVPYH